MHSGITRQLQGHGDCKADKRALEKVIRVRLSLGTKLCGLENNFIFIL